MRNYQFDSVNRANRIEQPLIFGDIEPLVYFL